MQLLWGARAARFSGPLVCCSDFSTAVFGVSPKTFPSFGPSAKGVGSIIVHLAGETPTRATGTVALPKATALSRKLLCMCSLRSKEAGISSGLLGDDFAIAPEIDGSAMRAGGLARRPTGAA
jgi:hypothetical protein